VRKIPGGLKFSCARCARCGNFVPRDLCHLIIRPAGLDFLIQPRGIERPQGLHPVFFQPSLNPGGRRLRQGKGEVGSISCAIGTLNFTSNRGSGAGAGRVFWELARTATPLLTTTCASRVAGKQHAASSMVAASRDNLRE